jgi:hypothetical protein
MTFAHMKSTALCNPKLFKSFTSSQRLTPVEEINTSRSLFRKIHVIHFNQPSEVPYEEQGTKGFSSDMKIHRAATIHLYK